MANNLTIGQYVTLHEWIKDQWGYMAEEAMTYKQAAEVMAAFCGFEVTPSNIETYVKQTGNNWNNVIDPEKALKIVAKRVEAVNKRLDDAVKLLTANVNLLNSKLDKLEINY